MKDKTIAQQQRDYDAQNLACARIIAADPERYSGIQLTWARAVLAKQPAAPQALRRGQIELFSEAA